MDDELVEHVYIVRALDLVEPFAEKLRESDSRDEGDPLPNYAPLVDELEDYSARVDALADTFPDSAYEDDLLAVAESVRGLPRTYTTQAGHEQQIETIATELEALYRRSAVHPDDFENILGMFEETIVVLDTLHQAYEHLATTTELSFEP